MGRSPRRKRPENQVFEDSAYPGLGRKLEPIGDAGESRLKQDRRRSDAWN